MGAACGCGAAPVLPDEDELPISNPVNAREFQGLGEDRLRVRVQEGGIDSNELRRQVWPRLLRVVDWQFDDTEFVAKQTEYEALRAQWEGSNDDLEACPVAAVVKYHRVIKGDVDRTDRKGPIFHEDAALQALRRVLLTFCCHPLGEEVGYFQGMNDMVAVMLHVFDWTQAATKPDLKLDAPPTDPSDPSVQLLPRARPWPSGASSPSSSEESPSLRISPKVSGARSPRWTVCFPQ